MPPKKETTATESAEGPRRSTRVASKPPPSEKQEAPQSAAKKPASKAKKPASKAAEKSDAPAKAPASKKRAAEDAPAKAPASKKTKADKADTTDAPAKPKSTTKAAKPASKAAEKPASKAGAATKAAKPASKKPASTTKPKSAAKPKSKKATTTKSIPEENGADAETEGKTEGEKKEIEAAAEGSEPEQSSALKDGDVLPSITLKNEKGDDVDVSTLVDEDHGVIFFTYPKADTPGCTAQACNFRDSYVDFSKLGYKVFGLSVDKPDAQQKWSTKQSFNYSLLSDTSAELIKKLGAFAAPKNTVRSHFIFEKGTGKLLEAKTKVKPAEDAANCLTFIRNHHSS